MHYEAICIFPHDHVIYYNMHEFLYIVSFMMADKYRYVRGKIFDGGNTYSAIKLHQIKIKIELIQYINNINETHFIHINLNYELTIQLLEEQR